MATGETVQRVRIYLNEHDRWEGQPLHLVVLEQLRRAGATGATALRGLAGFGPGQRSRTSSLTIMNDHPPVVIEWVDRIERINRTLPLLDEMLANALITLEDVRLYRAVLRSSGPFGSDRTVGDVMQPLAQPLNDAVMLDAALAILLNHNLQLLPVVDAEQRVIGTLSEEDLFRRAGFKLPLRVLRLLTPEERNPLLQALARHPVAEIMNSEIRVVYVSSAIPQALATMIEWNYAQIPVVDQNGLLAGLLSYADVLGAAIAQTTSAEGNVRSADAPTPVHLVMQTVVPQIAISRPLAMALEQLLLVPGRYLIAIDSAGRVQGSISDSGVLERLGGNERALWLAALQRGEAVTAKELPGNEYGLDTVLEPLRLTVAPSDTIFSVAQRMLEREVERAPVVDAEGKLLGLVARGGLLRALGQEST